MNEKFIQKVLEKFTKQITDQVFLMIQNDRDLYIEGKQLRNTLTLLI